MGLSWLLHYAWTIILGYPKEELVKGVDKSLKLSKDTSPMGKMYPSEGFQMPLHYPRYKKVDYGNMEEWKVDILLRQYGLNFEGTLDEKRTYAMGAFLWPDQL